MYLKKDDKYYGLGIWNKEPTHPNFSLKELGIEYLEKELYIGVSLYKDSEQNTELRYIPDKIKQNLRNIMGDEYISKNEIQVKYTNLGYIWSDCCIVFVNGKAKYIYATHFVIPYYDTKPNVSEKTFKTLMKIDEKIWNITRKSNTVVTELLSYKTIITLYRKCHEYGWEYDK